MYTSINYNVQMRARLIIHHAKSQITYNLIYFLRGFLTESKDFKQFKSRFVEIFPQL